MKVIKIRDQYGRFVTGSMPWNKNKTGIYSEEALEKMRKAKLGKHTSLVTEFKRGHKTWNKGIKGLYIIGSEKGWFKQDRKLSEEIENKRLDNLRKKILLRPNLKMNENLAFIVGLLKGDGYVGRYRHSYRINLDSTNELLATKFLEIIKDVGLTPFMYEIIPSNGIGKLKQFRVVANSKIFYEWYNELTIEKLKMLFDSKEKIIGFIRGFYEAEGSISIYKNKTICISISNTNLELIKLIKSLLEKLELNFNLNGPYRNNRFGGYNAKPIYRIVSGSIKQVQRFINLVKPTIKTLEL